MTCRNSHAMASTRVASLALAIVLLLVGCQSASQRVVSLAAPPTPAAAIATLNGTVTLSDVARACTAAASSSQAGAVVIRGNLRDENSHVTITVPCAVQLDGTASVTRANVILDSQTLNFSDKASTAGKTIFTLAHVQFTGQGDAGLLIELTDPPDRTAIAASTLDYPLGIAIRATGTRTVPDSGGTVAVADSTFTAEGPTSAGVAISASSSNGMVQIGNPVFNAPAVVALADHCVVTLKAKVVDCRTADLGAALKQQTHP